MAVNSTYVSFLSLRKQHLLAVYMDLSDQNYSDLIELSGQNFDTYVLHPWAWTNADLETNFYIFLVPILAVITLCTGAVVISVFFKEKLFSPTNILMTAIIVSDTITILSPSPFLLYIHTSGTAPMIPFHLCRIWDYFTKYIPEITHTASIWMTLALGLHRYIGVCLPFRAKTFCTRRTSLSFIVISYVCSCFVHVWRFIDTRYVKILVNDSNVQMNTCQAVHVGWLDGYQTLYECIYYWVFIVLIKIIPCVSLITLDIVMVRKLRQAERERFRFISDPHLKKKEAIRITWIVIFVAAILVVVEVPLTVVLILWTLTMIHGKMYVPDELLENTSVIFNLLIYISFPTINLLYCFMSKKFKRALFGRCRTNCCR